MESLREPGYEANPGNRQKDVIPDPTYPIQLKGVNRIARKLSGDEEMMARAADPRHTINWVTRYFGFKMMPFHFKLDRILFEGGFWDIMLPTEHGKSTYCNYVFPIKSLANDPDAAHATVGANIRDARRWIRAVKGVLETNDQLITDYPWLKKPGPKNRVWSASEIIISGRSDPNNAQNPSYAAFGEGSGDCKGRRAIAVLDDIEGKDHRESPTRRDSTMDWLTLEAMRMFEDPGEGHRQTRPGFFNVGTPYDPDSIHFTLARQNGFNVYRQPYKYASGKLIWPWKRDKILKFHKHWDKEEFYIAMCLDPTGGDESKLTMERVIERASAETRWKENEQITGFVCLDPAGGTGGKKSDYAGITVNRYVFPDQSLMPHVETLEAVKVTLGILEQVHMVANFAKQYGYEVICEGNSQQKTSYRAFFRQYYPALKVNYYLTTEHTKWDNKMGVTVMRTLLNEGLWKLVDVPQHPDMQVVMREVMTLGAPGAHDHLSMSVWFGIRWIYEKARRRVQGQNRNKMTYSFRQPVRTYG